MFTLGVIADIHSNFSALEAVISDIKLHYPKVKEIYNLGDTVGYGPDPQKCIDAIMSNKLITRSIKGNHDHYVAQASIPPGVNLWAEKAIHFQIENTSIEHRWQLANQQTIIYTKHLEFPHEIVVVHGSPQYPLSEYIHPETEKQMKLFDFMYTSNIDILLLGHTHIPYSSIKSLESEKELRIINPGSVGQPRDNDPRASYAVIDLNNLEVEIIRIEYDIQSVAQRMNSMGLPKYLSDRLFEGK